MQYMLTVGLVCNMSHIPTLISMLTYDLIIFVVIFVHCFTFPKILSVHPVQDHRESTRAHEEQIAMYDYLARKDDDD